MTDASPTADRRLLLVHAHPDDETIMTGGTIARYLAEGVDVRVLTFTLGEEGEVIGDEFAQLVADGGADQLGGYRIAELTRALAALSPAEGPTLTPRFLGGAGRWRDSGMAGAPSANHPRALVQAPFDEPVGVLLDLLLDFAPQVVVSYDASGTYGHPDHKLVHEVTAAAVARAREADAGPAKLYESVTEYSALGNGLAAARAVPHGWRMPHPGELPSYPDDEITTEVDVRAYYPHKVAGLAAHATQVTVAPSGTEYALSNNILQPILDHEHFILTDHDPRPALDGDRETDLFSGIG
ncbi:N-acetyl-1-D-myo-inositol-2-amino-2-deoxy-alpha-D-glucopyranoside deacetylase [Gordonia rubripertincta]|uniref:1D-myo-inositol 2-acetamido-2-deoxy-alpha-D-glucopyranoside deacetylase n=2 Tax=Gordonia rubripertincta TaxID=36822 RepID=A0AAW6R4I8_GORRU|nr:N-acetyl-1-D-myo-inositol-2-amino-2-deoxy-alpha-D-glucopyranoside deacetylase [Gordonia rubripertincta]MDG6779356.1 N-acetyl-1-D-myo-inositol-2-amino-2-deoxy-alpha-D-glucopyranoside deacetylase [Gordonia rubripertincta]NKY62666.1 N-acetyl-1-D-myo-inositol-2-amino-2-deoxy-alpha-D-glucopyranoside deacetylase [Gordonia rubripertincta]GAB85822.1 N-acetyl-1-D-myo-Inosityl-2-amino-2-deoxy-alpha-D-glucopyranoside deacetylase MshB [Gordonia rubripertincta NBRC 101908]